MFADFITEKGVGALARMFGVPAITVYSWRRRNLIPRRRWDTLIEAYGLTYDELRDMERARQFVEAA